MAAAARPIPNSENSREYSVLDGKPSRVINFPLTISQQVWLMFLLPSFISTAIFIFDLSTDIGLVLAFIEEKLYLASALTLLFTFLPAIVCYITRLMNPPQGQTNQGRCEWIFVETLAFILFPLRPLYCFAERIFWAIEAVRLDDPEREEALVAHEESRRRNTESYLFFQAYLHAGPQALLQLILIVWGVSSNFHTIKVQAIGFISSIASVSLTTTVYQRYELQTRESRKDTWKGTFSPPHDYITIKKEEVLESTPFQTLPRSKWVKVMDQDDPIGVIFSFLFWFFFLIGRCLCLVLATYFYPWAVGGVCIAHYLITFLYIFPSPSCKEAIPYKVFLPFLFIFCVIEVGVQFRKSFIWYGLLYSLSMLENVSLTLAWAIGSEWKSWGLYYALFVILSSHILASIFLIVYVKYFRPHIKRIDFSLKAEEEVHL